jgi:hypothetical protein
MEPSMQALRHRAHDGRLQLNLKLGAVSPLLVVSLLAYKTTPTFVSLMCSMI